jgi:RimJ/RimL family protein N-acetyltransferase
MKLATRRLVLRPVRLTDASDFVDHFAHAEVADFSTARPRSIQQMRKHLRRVIKEGKTQPWARRSFSILLRSGMTWIGGIDLRWPHPGVGELGYGINPEHWGRGYATEAVKKLVDAAFSGFGAHRVQATCEVSNVRSARVLKKAGLRQEGRLRGFTKRGAALADDFIFGVAREDRRRRA